MASMASIRPASIHSSRLGLRVVAEHDPSAIRQSVGTAEDQYLEELLEDHPIRYTGPMAAQRMIRFSLGQQGTELLPDGIDNVWLDRGHGHTPSPREASRTPRMIGYTVSALQIEALPPYWRKLLVVVELIPRRSPIPANM